MRLNIKIIKARIEQFAPKSKYATKKDILTFHDSVLELQGALKEYEEKYHDKRTRNCA